MSTSIMWFRRDLRLADNPALVDAAASTDDVVGFFCLDQRLRDPAGPVRLAYLSRCLRALDRSMGGRLVIRTGDPVDVLPGLAAECGATSVHAAEDFGPYGRARDAAVSEALAGDDIELALTGSPYAVPPGSVSTKAGTPYRVFTPFARAWRDHGWPEPEDGLTDVSWRALHSEPVPDEPELGGTRLPDVGEEMARSRLDQFLAHAVHGYADGRDRPGDDTTSRLSPDLKWGVLHPRQILHRLGHSEGERVFATELCWREFYADVLFHSPSSARESMDERVGAMEWDRGPDTDERFRAWTRGETGYPVVDAGMRQLLAEGWVHNRVRMLVASFFVKDLHLDWQRGARWFMQRLADGDLASNQHGWQWTAGTGTDPSPYFRIFNPVGQGKRYDPGGAYVRRYVPELALVPEKYVHEPWKDPAGLPPGYPPPIVDHAEEREESLRRYGATR